MSEATNPVHPLLLHAPHSLDCAGSLARATCDCYMKDLAAALVELEAVEKERDELRAALRSIEFTYRDSDELAHYYASRALAVVYEPHQRKTCNE